MSRAAVLVDERMTLEVEDLADPSPRDGEVLIEVRACGVCHTDLHVMKGEVSFPRPAVMGHEISGVVAAIGRGVTHVRVGDRVACCFIMPCGTCRHCVRGAEDLCETFFSHNRLRGVLYDGETRLFRRDGSPVWMYSMGGLAELCVVPATAVSVLPDEIDLVQAAVLGCSVFTALGAVRNVAKVGVGDTVAVMATGGVGLNIVQMARAFGASRVVAVDISADKLELAVRMGATDVVDASAGDAAEQVRALTGGRGVDVAFEALGTSGTVDQAIRSVDDGGRAVLVGIAPAGVRAAFDITHVVRRKIQVLGSYGARARSDMPLVLELAASGRVNLDDLVTRRYRLADAADAYADLAAGRVTGRAVVEMTT